MIAWDANAETFGIAGLAYFAEGSNVGYATIEAVFEEVPTETETETETETKKPESETKESEKLDGVKTGDDTNTGALAVTVFGSALVISGIALKKYLFK